MAAGVSGVAQKQPVPHDLAAVTEAAKAELDRAIALSGLQRDPLRHSFQALRVHLDAMHQLVSHHIEEARRPIGREDLERLVRSVVRQADLHVAQRSMQVTIGGIVVGVLLLAAFCYGSFWYGQRAYEQEHASVLGWGRALQAACEEKGAIVNNICHASIPVAPRER